MRKALLCAGLALALAGCAALPGPRPTPSETAEARATRTHHPTRTPRPTEPATEPPSATPEPAASPTATAELIFPTVAPPPTALPASAAAASPAPNALDCDLIWQSPPNGALYNIGEKFSTGWKIKNAGTAAWEPGNTRFVYLGGAKLVPDYWASLPTSVAPGASIVLSVPMRAPWHPGVYTTHWGIQQGGAYFCRLTLTIQVRSS